MPALKDQIDTIRNSGLVNMFDTRGVQRIAFDSGYHDLVDFIESNRAAYCKFVLCGDETVLHRRD